MGGGKEKIPEKLHKPIKCFYIREEEEAGGKNKLFSTNNVEFEFRTRLETTSFKRGWELSSANGFSRVLETRILI